MRFLALTCALLALSASGCNARDDNAATWPFAVTEVARFDEPWDMAFLPDNTGALVTEKAGHLKWWTGTESRDIAGVPAVAYAEQGGFGDVALAPDYATSGIVYLSWVEAGEGDLKGAVVGRAHLAFDGQPRLENLTVIWRQTKVTGEGYHYSHRLRFSPDGQYLFVTSGERNKKTPAQDVTVNLGKVLRLTPDGRPAPGNPFAGQGGQAAEVWSYGHRNLYGLYFDKDGRLWENEMGPMGGDEVNLIEPGHNYGWPVVSNGSNYDGSDVPDHPTRPDFTAPKLWWNPSISPSSLLIYDGSQFPQWQGDMFITALSGQALVRVDLDGGNATKAEQWEIGRLREVVQGPDGALYILEDGAGDPGGRLLRLTPKT